MDSLETFVFDLGWLFFAAWGMGILALCLIAFKADLAEFVSARDTSASRSGSETPSQLPA